MRQSFDSARAPSTIVSRLKSFAIGAVILIIVIYSFYGVLFRQTNEIGPIGVDKAGRQIFLQTIEVVYKDRTGLRVTSEWDDSTFIERMMIKEPMRTTIRFVTEESAPLSEVLTSRIFLDAPWETYFAGAPADGKMHVREDVQVSVTEFVQALNKIGAKTNEDMLAAMGFRRYEMYHGERLIVRYELKKIGKGNVKWMGGE